MKRLYALLLVFVLFFSASAFADLPDISSLSYDELIELRDLIDTAILNTQEWQEVTVPAGIWEVGKDIPVGHWMVYPPDDDIGQVYYCEVVDYDRKLPDSAGKYHTIVLAGKKSGFANQTANYIDYDMKSGWFFINNVTVTFTPYPGKPDLGFK